MSGSVFITGASRGIGLCVTEKILTSYPTLKVIAASRSVHDSSSLASLSRQHSGRLILQPLDITDEESIKRAGEALGKEPCPMLFHGAALMHPSGKGENSVGRLCSEEMAAVMQTNVVGPALLTGALWPALRRAAKTAPSKVVAVGAGVGSIGTNAAGGWYSYRISKTARGMLSSPACLPARMPRNATVGRSSVLRVSAGNGKWQTVPAADVKALINDKGYTILDIRSPTEVSEVGYKFTWQTIPLAALTDEGPVRNPYFLATVKEAFPNTMSRMLVACDDGTFRSDMAADMLTEQGGYTNLSVIEGGIDGYLVHDPLTEKDKVKWQMEQQAGHDLSELVTGVDTRQASQKFY